MIRWLRRRPRPEPQNRPPHPDEAPPSAGNPGPGTRLLTEQLCLPDPLTSLTAQHPPGTDLHRLARALCQSAAELDEAHSTAHGVRRRLHPQDHHDGSTAAWTPDMEAQQTILRCELTDTALIRLLAAYQDMAGATLPTNEAEA